MRETQNEIGVVIGKLSIPQIPLMFSVDPGENWLASGPDIDSGALPFMANPATAQWILTVNIWGRTDQILTVNS